MGKRKSSAKSNPATKDNLVPDMSHRQKNANKGGSAASAPRDPHQLWFRIGLGFVLFLALLVTYSNSFEGPFLLDNQQIILLDPRLRAFEWEPNIHNIFTKDYWWPTLASDLYRPITTFTYMLNWSVLGNGNNPEGYHVVNFILHLINVFLVYKLLRQFGTRELVAYWAAAIFGLHPVATEGVTNIVGRADLLSTFFVLSATLCYAHSAKSKGGKRIGWLLGMVPLSILGVLSKESGVMILPAMFFYDWLYRNHSDQAPLPKSWSHRFDVLLPGYLCVVPSLLLFVFCRHVMSSTSPTYGNPFVDNPIELAGFFSGRMTALKVLGQYFWMLIWPARLSCDWSYNQIPLYGPDAPWHENIQSWVAIVLILTLLYLAWTQRKRFPLMTFGIIWFFVAIFPMSNLPITIGSIKAERFLYMPYLGFALMAAMGLEWVRSWLANTLRPVLPSLTWLSFTLPLVVLMAFSVRTYLRNQDWSSEYALWSSAVETCPNSFKTYKGFSNCFITKNTEEGADQAIAVAEKGVAILENPPLPIERKDNTLYINIAFHYARKAEFCMARGARDEGMKYFEKALGALEKAKEVDRFANSTSRAKFMRQGIKAENIRNVGNPTIYELFTAVYIGMGRYAEAEQAALYNLNLNPYANRANVMLGEVHARQKNYERAAIYWIRQLFFDPSSRDTWENLVKAYNLISPDRPAVQALPEGGYTLLKDNPIARRNLNQACVETYRLLLETIHEEDALSFRKKAIENYNCPPELLPLPAKRTL